MLTALILAMTLPLAAMDSVNKNAGTVPYRGEGMVVAVLDLEFDVNHELFTLSEDTIPKFGKDDITAAVTSGLNCTDRLKLLNKSPYVNEKIPFAYDYAEGDANVSGIGLVHGTHVAGIIGANKASAADPNAAFDGIAPEAQLLLMKVGSADGNIDYNAALDALNDALTIGADVINLSWGVAAGFGDNVHTNDYTNIIRRAMNQGIDIVVSAGNTPRVGNMSEYDKLYGISDPLASDPDYGLISAPSLTDQAISVASYNNDSIKAKGHIETFEGKKIIYSEAYQAFAKILAKPTAMLDYIVVESKGSQRLYEDDTVNYRNKLVVMEYTNDTAMMAYLKKRGALGVIFYSQYENDPFMRTVKSAYVPVVFISNEDGGMLIESAKYQLTLYEYPSAVEVKNPAGGTMSYYSAWGATSGLGIKPDITAIGGNVYSASPGNQYETMSGTSMSSPVIAGSLAVIKQYLRESVIESNEYTARQLLMSAAEPIINPGNGIEYSPRRQGAGLLKLDNAVNADILVYNIETMTAKIELGDKIDEEDDGDFTIEFCVRNLTSETLEYEITASIFTDGYYYDETLKKYFTADYSHAMTRAQVFQEGGGVNINVNSLSRGGNSSAKITIGANKTVTVRLNVIFDKTETRKLMNVFPNGFFTEGFIYLTPAYDGGITVSLPYLGFRGNWNDAPIFDDGFYTQSLGSSFRIESGDVYYELGYNIFTDDDAPVNRSLYAFSPGDDGGGDLLMFISKSLRNYYLRGFYITDAVGNIIFEGLSDEFRTKAYVTGDEIYSVYDVIWDGRDKANSKYIHPDGLYYMYVLAGIDKDGADTQVYTAAFYIDTRKPAAKDNKVSESGGKIEYSFTASDDFGVQAVRIFDNAGMDEIVTFSGKMKSSRVSIDITDFVGKNGKDASFYIEVIDYAMNTVTYKINLEDYKL